MRMSSVFVLLLLGSISLGFLIPYWIFHRLFWDESVCCEPRRYVRATRGRLRPETSMSLHLENLGFLGERYFAEIEATLASASGDSDDFLLVEKMTTRDNHAFNPQSVNHTNTRCIDAPSVFDIAQEARAVFRRICRREARDHHSWIALVDKATYVNTFMLRHFLRRLPTSTPIIIGKSLENNAGVCLLNPGVLMNKAAIKTICANKDPEGNTCDETAHRSGSSSCQARHWSIGCLDITRKIPSFFRDLDRSVLSDKNAARDFAFNTAFVERSLNARDLVMLRRAILDTRTEAVRQSIDVLLSTSGKSVSAQRLKRQSESGMKLSKYRLPLPFFLRTGSVRREGVYLLIDEHGRLYKQTCPASASNVLKLSDVSPSYLRTLQLANGSLPDADGLRRFGFKLHRPNDGHEYHVYFVEEATGYGLAQSYEVITLQRYERARIRDKSVISVQPLVMLLALPCTEFRARYVLEAVRRTLDSALADSQRYALMVNPSCSESLSYAGGLLEEYGMTGKVIKRSSNGSWNLLGELSRHPEKSVFVYVSPDATFQKGFLERCSLHARQGISAYFPIPLLRRDLPKASDTRDVHDQTLWRVWGGEALGVASFSTYCASISDIGKVTKSGCDVTNGEAVYNATRGRLSIERRVDHSLQMLST